MKVVLIGSGNVATVLGRSIKNAGHSIEQVVSRVPVHAQALASALDAEPVINFDDLTGKADIYIISVPDDSIKSVANQIRPGDRFVVHTSGSVPKDVLKAVSRDYGVLYPLQSLRKELIVIPEIPFLVDANTEVSLNLIETFARSLSGSVRYAGDAERLKLHVAAVIVSNFTNHLYAIAQDYCLAEGLDFRLLFPLISEVAQRIETNDPAKMQTGPAIRNDEGAIKKHIEFLDAYPQLKKLYVEITNSIRQYAGRNE